MRECGVLRPYEEELTSLRKSDKDFDALVSEITIKIDNFISESNSQKSYNPKNVEDRSLSLFVTAIPITSKQRSVLLDYLNSKYSSIRYISMSMYERFTIRKCLFSNRYHIRLKLYSFHYGDDWT